ncbi:undecaprenyl pyrophosphate synthase [Candidatus Sulfotelmatomonas gaucii]|uniref:Isoprenyl transferase n=1 Tax=Candidatus Sulfuritelmatomonas gaucii TaxID=2043161 RepID=A0A2N9LCY4_9BACT|nr:undecaprenyl pyrophosphate synthase [Candidatus Sulfotelmatomonas gaucii]
MQPRGESLSPSPASRVNELSAEERAVYAALKPERLPQHVAIIMDGNGRWAGRRSLKRFVGHQQGAKAVQLVTETASRINLPWLTLYAFSLENNLRRPRAEVNFLMRLLKTYLDSNLERMRKNNVRMRYIGRTHDLPPEVQDKMRWAEEATARNTGTTLTLALNYGGRSELVDAFRGLAAEMKNKHLSLDHITEEDVHRHLYTAQMPDPDLLIRTSGEQRISNFLLWQIAYTEIFVTDRYWPDFRGVHLLEAIADFQRRERRYGGIGEDSGEVEEDFESIKIAAS